jgi:hypothetical protein
MPSLSSASTLLSCESWCVVVCWEKIPEEEMLDGGVLELRFSGLFTPQSWHLVFCDLFEKEQIVHIQVEERVFWNDNVEAEGDDKYGLLLELGLKLLLESENFSVIFGEDLTKPAYLFQKIIIHNKKKSNFS